MKYFILLEDNKINTYTIDYNQLRKNDMLIDLISKYSYYDEIVINNLKVRNKYIPHSTSDYNVIKCDIENYRGLNAKNRNKNLLVDIKEKRQYYPMIYKILKKDSLNTILKLLEKWINLDEEYDIRKAKELGIKNSSYDELNPIAQDKIINKYQIIYDYFDLFEFTLVNSEDVKECETRLKQANEMFLKTNKKSDLTQLKKEIQNLNSIINSSKENKRIIDILNIRLNINDEKTNLK